MNWKMELQESVSQLLGFSFEIKDIHSDRGFFYYLQDLSHPFIGWRCCGPLFCVIPHGDYEKLSHGEIHVKQYINQSIWGFGHCVGDGDIYNTYWRVFDKGGILSTFEIRQYLIRERCRVQGISAGVTPSKEACFGCCIQYESCLCSPSRSCPYIRKEIDCRRFLQEAIMQMVGYSGFVLENFGAYSGEHVRIIPGNQPSCVEVLVPQKLLNKLLDITDPSLENWDTLAANLSYEVSLRRNSKALSISVPLEKGEILNGFEELRIAPLSEHEKQQSRTFRDWFLGCFFYRFFFQ